MSDSPHLSVIPVLKLLPVAMIRHVVRAMRMARDSIYQLLLIYPEMTNTVVRPSIRPCGVWATENAGPENAVLENDGPERRAVVMVQDHLHTLKTVPISLCRQTNFETVIFLP